MESIERSADYLRNAIGREQIDAAIVLGSGLGELGERIEEARIIPYKDIPEFPISTVPGHKGQLIIGYLEGKRVLCMQGRFHYYEGWSMNQVVHPIRTMHLLGISQLILTNAAGCVNTEWAPGDLMIITDHIKLVADSPLRGPNPDKLGPRFFDMTEAYDRDLIKIAEEAGERLGLGLRKGVYMFFSGPSFETPAEIRFARMAGADAVGMSTVPEAIAAAHMGMRTLGISCMTNMAAGILDQPLSHEEVVETGRRVSAGFEALVREIVRKA